MKPACAFHLNAALLCTLLVAAAPARAVTPNGKLQINHLDVGQGDGAVLVTPLGQVVMIDCGVNTKCTLIATQLATLGITHVDYHFASHYHSDHIGCFPTLDATQHFGQVWDHGGSYTTQTYTNYVNTAGFRRHAATVGRVWTLDSLSAHPVTITCVDLHNGSSDENLNSMMLVVKYGEFRESFGGDQQSPSYESTYGPEVDTVLVYKVHHHGSATSSSDAWLNAVAPKVGVISCGDGNSYGHPTATAVARLHQHHVHTYWTETGAGVAPDSVWDKVAHGMITINAAWQGVAWDYISGGSGGGAFRDSLQNPGAPPVVGVDDRVAESWPLRTLRNPSLRSVRFAVGVTGSPMSDLRIYAVDGRQVWTVFRGVLPQGEQTFGWDGRDESGRPVDSGVYFAVFSSRGRSEVVKFLLLK